MTIYYDSEHKCHVEPATGLTAVETDFFAGKCPELIEGYCYVPFGETVERNGMVYVGPLIYAWKPFDELIEAQMAYLEGQLAEADTALEVIYGEQN